MASLGLKFFGFFISILQLLSIGVNLAAIIITKWIYLGPLTGSLLECTSCAGNTSYSDLKSLACSFDSGTTTCVTYTDLYIGGILYIVGGSLSMLFTVLWIIFTLILTVKGRGFVAALVFGGMAFVVQAAVFIAYMALTQTRFMDCDASAPTTDRRPYFCADDGPKLAIADGCFLAFVLICFVIFGVCRNRRKALESRAQNMTIHHTEENSNSFRFNKH
jgi:hypothetical protein